MSQQITRVICFRNNGELYKFCRVSIANDGTIMVFMPYLKYQDGDKFVFQKNIIPEDSYEFTTLAITPEIMKQGVASSKVKICYHPSGFIQFSSAEKDRKIISGIDDKTGEIKGMGVNSSPLEDACEGPVISVLFQGDVALFQKQEGSKREVLELEITKRLDEKVPALIMYWKKLLSCVFKNKNFERDLSLEFFVRYLDKGINCVLNGLDDNENICGVSPHPNEGLFYLKFLPFKIGETNALLGIKLWEYPIQPVKFKFVLSITSAREKLSSGKWAGIYCFYKNFPEDRLKGFNTEDMQKT